jgi:hypothetical protein
MRRARRRLRGRRFEAGSGSLKPNRAVAQGLIAGAAMELGANHRGGCDIERPDPDAFTDAFKTMPLASLMNWRSEGLPGVWLEKNCY